jgi:hypothetical protein
MPSDCWPHARVTKHTNRIIIEIRIRVMANLHSFSDLSIGSARQAFGRDGGEGNKGRKDDRTSKLWHKCN